MADDYTQSEQPLTPAGRLFVQPQMEQIINCTIAGFGPLNVDAIRTELQNSVLLKHPRFTSLLVRDSSNGREYWRRTEVDPDRHLIIKHHALSEDSGGDYDEDSVINDYVAELSITGLPVDKPLWEIHLLLAHNAAVFRIHHALGDGVSLMSLLLSCCRRVDDPTRVPTIGGIATAPKRRWNLLILLKLVWYTLVYVLEFVLRALWLRDKDTAVSGGAGVELWPRRLATARFKIEDMKVVKQAVSNATINDVLFGIISSGLSKYLDIRSSKGLREGLQLTGLAMVNLRPQAGLQDMAKLMNSSNSSTRWGNKFGIILLPVYYHRPGSDPIHFVKRAKAMIDKKKLSLEAPFSYKVGDLVMSIFGAKLASILNYRIICNTTFTISNIVGPREEIMFVGSRVKYIKATSSGLPHALTMHMVSCAGEAHMQILVAKEIIPDPKVLAKCFEDSLLEMKEAATKS